MVIRDSRVRESVKLLQEVPNVCGLGAESVSAVMLSVNPSPESVDKTGTCVDSTTAGVDSVSLLTRIGAPGTKPADLETG